MKTLMVSTRLLSLAVVFHFLAAVLPAATYEQDFDNFANGTSDLGDGSVMAGTARVMGLALELTLDGGASGFGSFSIPALPGSAAGWTATFDLTITDSAGNNEPADGLSFNYGNFNLGVLGAAEEGMGAGDAPQNLSFEIDTWMNLDAEQGVNISGNWGGAELGQLAFTNGPILLDGTSVSGLVTISYDPTSGASFTTAGLNTNAAFSNIAVTPFAGDNAFNFALSARVGGANETVLIDNLTVITSGSNDNDGDGLPNTWEVEHLLDPESAVGDNGAAGDPDADSLTNLQEFQLGTDPRDNDTDNDTLLDGAEVAGSGLRPPTSPTNPDTDTDGLSDGVETNTGTYAGPTNTGTNPTIADTDSDGVNDGQEVAAGRDPTVAEPVGDILITEFMASNASTLQDFQGDYSDWIEIYNDGSFSIDLAGWHLTDDVGNLSKWTFPTRILAPGEFLVVFASSKNLNGAELHTNFRLSAAGEYLALVEPDGVTVSHEFAPTFPAQLTDVSYGLEMSATTTDFVTTGSAGRYHIPTSGALGTTWTSSAFNDGSWTSGTNGFGFDSSGTLAPFISTNIQGAMMGTNSGAYLRYPFTITGAPDFDSLRLDMAYDDGFAAYLNGTAVDLGNAPASPVWNATALAGNSGGLVVNNFAAPETGLALVNHSSTPASIIAGADPHLRLVYNGTGSNHNSIHFNRTDLGPFNTVVAEFDFRMNGTADGFSFLMLPTGTYGTTTASPGVTLATAEEPNVAGLFAVGFDIYNNIDEISLHYGSVRGETNRQGTIDLNANVWHRAKIQLTPTGGGGTSVNVSVTPNVRGAPGTPVVFHSNVSIPDLNPYEYRVQFSARTGGATTNVDLDSISVSQSGANGSLTKSTDISPHLGLLQSGANVLALHGLNITAADTDFLARPLLSGVAVNSVNVASVFYYETSTPGAPNDAGTNGFAGPVSFSPAGRTFNSSLNVTLATPIPGGEIRYTTNGTVPTQASTLYTGPIALSGSARLRARAFVPNFSPGPLASETYFRLEADLQSFTSNLPIVVVDNFAAGGFPGAGSAYQPMVMAVFDRQAGTGRSALTNVPDLVTRGGAHKRGSSTAGQSKPNLRIETWGEEDNVDVAAKILDFPRESDFILYAPYDFDRAFMRNAFMYRLSNELGQYAVRTRFVEVFANTGGGSLSYASDYHGVYVLMESIKRDKDRVNITKLNPGENTAPEVTGGYIWKVDRGSPAFTTVGQGDQQVIEDPDSLSITGAQNAWLQSHLNAFGTALNGGNFTDPVLGYAPYIDAPSWIDHHVLNVLAFNVDALRLSTYLHKDRNTPIVKGPVWDFDRSLESYDGRDDNPQTWGDTGGTIFFQRGWYNRLFDDPDFGQFWIDRWCELRQPGGEFSNAHLFSVLDEMQAECTEAAPRNYARWTAAPPSHGGSLAGEVQNIKNWLALRTAWIDSQMAGVASFSQNGGVVPSGFQVTLTPPASSSIYYKLDGSDPRGDGGAFAGTGYSGPITLTQSARLVTRAYKAGNPTTLFDSRWGCPREAVFLVGSQAASQSNLVISEVHYHPAPPTPAEMTAGFLNDDDFEFIELLNTGSQLIDLVDCRFDQGLDFTFPLNSTVAAGQRIILARNPAAFALRYGGGLNVVGGYPADRLNNDGEHLRLVDWNGAVLSEFTYNDVWYRPTDGQGYSLELRNPATPVANLRNKASWAISGVYHGTPGYASSVFGQAYSVWLEDFFTAPEIADSNVSGPLIDGDDDGLNNLLEYAFKLSPHTSTTTGLPVASIIADKLTLSFRRWKNAIDLTYAVEVSGDLINWTEVTGVVGTPIDHADGTETVTITDTEILANGMRRFLRVLVTKEN
jgi:hypothetical protein